MWINTNFPFLGASPDGIIFENCCPVGVLEVKCLKVFKTSSIHDFLNFWTCIQQTFGRAGYCSVWKKKIEMAENLISDVVDPKILYYEENLLFLAWSLKVVHLLYSKGVDPLFQKTNWWVHCTCICSNRGIQSNY